MRLDPLRMAVAALELGPRAGCFWLESRLGFPNQSRSDSTCWLGGGQQGMPKPYSQDLRDRVIDAVERGRDEPPRSGAALRNQRIGGDQVA